GAGEDRLSLRLRELGRLLKGAYRRLAAALAVVVALRADEDPVRLVDAAAVARRRPGVAALPSPGARARAGHRAGARARPAAVAAAVAAAAGEPRAVARPVLTGPGEHCGRAQLQRGGEGEPPAPRALVPRLLVHLGSSASRSSAAA